MKGVVLKPESKIIFHGEAIFYKVKDMEKAMNFVKKKIKK